MNQIWRLSASPMWSFLKIAWKKHFHLSQPYVAKIPFYLKTVTIFGILICTFALFLCLHFRIQLLKHKDTVLTNCWFLFSTLKDVNSNSGVPRADKNSQTAFPFSFNLAKAREYCSDLFRWALDLAERKEKNAAKTFCFPLFMFSYINGIWGIK